MKKNHLRILTGIIILVALWMVIRWTGMFQMYRIPTSSNSPTLNAGDWIYVSNLWEPETLDFVCFENSKEEVLTKRLVAKAGDEIEIKNSILFVNGKNIDKKIDLKHNYLINKEDLNLARSFDRKEYYSALSEDSLVITLSDENSSRISSARLYIEQTQGNLHKDFSPVWTMDNLGPITVPKNHVFVLGDNRHNSMDARYFGFVPTKKIVGTILNY